MKTGHDRYLKSGEKDVEIIGHTLGQRSTTDNLDMTTVPI